MPIALGVNNIQRTGGTVSAISAIGTFTDSNIITSTGQDFTVNINFPGGIATTSTIPAEPVSVNDQVTMNIQVFKPAPNAVTFLTAPVNGVVTSIEPEPNGQAIYTIEWDSYSGTANISGSVFPDGSPLSLRFSIGTVFSAVGVNGTMSGTQAVRGGIFLGSTPVSRVYLGNNQIWPSAAPPPPPLSWNGSVSAVPISISDNIGFTSGSDQIYLTELIFESNGNIKTRSNSSGQGVEITVGQWSGTNANSLNTEVRFTLQSSTNSSLLSGTTANFVSLASNRVVTYSGTNISTNSATVRVSLRETGNPASVVEKDVTFSIGNINNGGPGDPGDSPNPPPPGFEP